MLNECRCKFYKRHGDCNNNTTHASSMRLRYCRCFSFSCICQHLLNQLILIQILPLIVRIPPYFLRMLANLYKRLTITTNALLLIRMACNCLRICCEYAFLTEFRNMILKFAIPLDRSECLRIRTNVWQ